MITMNMRKYLIIAGLIGSSLVLELLFNKPRRLRYRQKLLPVLAMVFSIIAGIACWRFLDKIFSLMPYIRRFSDIDILLANQAALTGFIPVKCIILTFFQTKRESVEEEGDQEGPYYYDRDYNQYFLNDRWRTFKVLFLLAVIIYAIFCVVFLGLTVTRGRTSVFWVRILPVTVLMAVTETYCYLNGYTRDEYKYRIVGDDSYSQKITSYFRIRTILEALFPMNVLQARTGDEYKARKSTIDYVKELENSSDPADQKVAEYFSANAGEESYDVDYIRAIQKLMQRKNVVFFNPFYRDLGKYIILPLINALVSDEKVLIILGRNSTKEDVKVWISELLKEFCRFESVWIVDEIGYPESKYDVGILCFNELYDIRNLEGNKEFFDNTGFVLMMEPSLVINTGQIGFSILSDQMKETGISPVYCIIDRMVEGLVDTMSHLLHEKIEEVIAPPVPRSIFTDMAWDADGDYMRQSLFDKETRYLGSGFEISAVAVKNQIPTVKWISESKSPIKDLKWIIGQHYTVLCKYMNLPVQQSSIYEKIDFSSNLWSSRRQGDQFILVDDEFCNLYTMIRMFLSRAENQAFVNVMSESYLLRDYMRCNQRMFSTNPNLVPSIVPDYARTERNTLFKLLYMMAFRAIPENTIRRELQMANIESDDVGKAIKQLIRKYTHLDGENLITIHTSRITENPADCEIEFLFSISLEDYQAYLKKELSPAYYIVEKENAGTEYIDARLFCQVAQTILPGQFVVYDGKYYIVHSMDVDKGVILRRASDLYDRRCYYRQVRKYTIKKPEVENIVGRRKIMDIVMETCCIDFSVRTTGYLELKTNHDLKSARLVDFSDDDIVEDIQREYRNKNILGIRLPDTSDQERFTIAMLLMEMFRSVYPNTWQYLACVTSQSGKMEGMISYMMYELEGDIEKDYIYIIEDSNLDLGLIEAIEKNFMRFMELLCDFINWHFEMMRGPSYIIPEPENVIIPEDLPNEKRKKGLLALLEKLLKLIGAIKAEAETEPETEKDQADSSAGEKEIQEEDQKPETEKGGDDAAGEKEIPGKGQESETEKGGDDAAGEKVIPGKGQESETEKDQADSSAGEKEILDGDRKAKGTDTQKENHLVKEVLPEYRTRYQRECFLKFGYDEIDDHIVLDDVRKYLNARGWAHDTSVSLARKRDVFLPDARIYMAMENCCDFCGVPLSGVSYERLTDGRIRCNDCSASAITSLEDFRELFQHTLALMQNYYGIEFKKNITVKTADARKIARGVNMVFQPSTEYTPRILGYAQKAGDQYSVIVENGSPRLATIATMVHEMTHIWQYLNWNDKSIIKIYGKDAKRDLIYEGMAKWAEIQYLYLIGETAYAAQEEELTRQREDVYGIGFVLYCSKYPLIKDFSLIRNSPFKEYPPL